MAVAESVLTGRALVTAPTEEPVTRALAIAHLREDADTVSVDLLDFLIRSAREQVEDYLWRKCCRQTWDFWYSAFPCGSDAIELPFPPLISIDAITYVDEDGDSQTLSSALYTSDTSSEPGRVKPVYNTVWPATRDSTMQAVKVRATLGYGIPANVPVKVKRAILVVLGDAYEHRESIIVGTISSRIEGVLDSLLSDHMRPMIG